MICRSVNEQFVKKTRRIDLFVPPPTPPHLLLLAVIDISFINKARKLGESTMLNAKAKKYA